jgi:glutaredoxin
MTIFVIGKSSCKKCHAALQKLDLLKLEYTYFAQDKPENWRNVEGLIEAFASSAFAAIDFKTQIPIIVIDGKAYLYSEAMKVLKQK